MTIGNFFCIFPQKGKLMTKKVPNLYELSDILWSSFRDIYFEDEGHRYTDSEGNEYKSVSTVITEHHDKFNDKEVAPFTAAKMTKQLGSAMKFTA